MSSGSSTMKTSTSSSEPRATSRATHRMVDPDSSAGPSLSIWLEVGENLVTLHLDHAGPTSGGGPSEADVLRHTRDEAFGTLANVLEAGDARTPAEAAIWAVGRCRAELAAGVAADILDPLARSYLESTRNLAAHARNRAAERRTQVAGLVAMVRETVATTAGEQASLHETLTGSAERFEHLVQVDDLQQIQAQLFNEVATLKRITIERRAAWERTLQEFGTRLTTLETQLDRTRREAAVDPLTNVGNRRTFERTCRDWLEANAPSFVMAMADVDTSKQRQGACRPKASPLIRDLLKDCEGRTRQ